MKQPNEYSNDEVYIMLRPKLTKAIGDFPARMYNEAEIVEAIALAYKSGYLRAKKGRSFIIGEKKQVTKVKFIDEDAHFKYPMFFPSTGTIGIVVQDHGNYYSVDWGENSSVGMNCDGNYIWSCEKNKVEVVE